MSPLFILFNIDAKKFYSSIISKQIIFAISGKNLQVMENLEIEFLLSDSFKYDFIKPVASLWYLYATYTPPLWTDLVKMSSRKLRHASSFSFERTDFKNVIFENIHWAHSEDTKVAEVKQPRNPRWQKF